MKRPVRFAFCLALILGGSVGVVSAQPLPYDNNIAKASTVGRYTWLPARLNADQFEDVIIITRDDGCMWKWYGTAGNPNTKRWDFQTQLCMNGRAGDVKNATFVPMDFNGDGLTDLLILDSSGKCYWKWYSTNTIGPGFDFKNQCCINGPCTGH
jgi:hypothetical protein